MAQAAQYCVLDRLRDGRSVDIRAVRPDDRGDLLAAIGRVSPQTLSRRFFAPKRDLSPQEIAFFVDVDFVNHVALVAAIQEGGKPLLIGGGRYIVTGPGMAELAFVVVDRYQGHGLGTLLLRHLATIARGAELDVFNADVLAENTAMLKVFEQSGFAVTKTRDADVVHVRLELR
jgi:RimJ/RimL family protein N-acetyltransferase